MGSNIKQNTLIIDTDNIGFASYDRILFQNLNLNIKMGEVTAITGKSGSGKTVLLKILAKDEKIGEGKMYIDPRAVTMFAPQTPEDINIDKKSTIFNVLKSARGLDKIEAEIQSCEKKMTGKNYGDCDIEQYGMVMEKYKELGGYSSESDMKKILAGLGLNKNILSNISLETKLGEVSSGQLKKVMIAMVLYSNADLILLDEPSSHLDVVSVEWLSDYLSHTKAAVVFTSNDRQFIDNCASQTMGLTDSGRVFVFDGGFTDFIKKRDAILESEKLAAEQIANKLAQLEKTDMMFRSKQVYKRSSDMAQVGRALETRMNRLRKEYENMPGSKQITKDEKVKDLYFTQKKRSGDEIVIIENIIKRYGEFEAVNFKNNNPITIRRKERWLLWGPNGSGKSTLAKMIVDSFRNGKFIPDEGKIKIGTNIDLAFYTPELPLDISRGKLIDEITNKIDNPDQRRSVSILRYFGFSNNAIYNQDVRTLSLGEKKRLALVIIMLKQPNLIILDEPTGDYMSKEIKEKLAESLKKYEGTLIVISHDLDFIEQIKFDKKLFFPEGKISIV